MRHPDYSKISRWVRHQTSWSDDEPLVFANEGADLYYLSYVSSNADLLLGHSNYRCDEHRKWFAAEPTDEAPADALIRENTHFRYPLVREHQIGCPLHRHRRLTILLHGLNERSFGKYLPWAYQTWTETGAPVLLFPLAFHVNRVLPFWGRQVPETLARRRQVPGNQTVHSFNAVISERLERHPERFFWGGLQSYRDLVDLANVIRSGRHPHFAEDARIDFVGYSAGGYIALMLMMVDESGLFHDSRGAIFASCVALRDLNLSSPLIVDLMAEFSLLNFYVKYLEKHANARLKHWMEAHTEGQLFRAFCGLMPDLAKIGERLKNISPRLLGFSNENDHVTPQAAMFNSLQGVFRDTGVRIERLRLGIHENPFSCPDYDQQDRKYVTSFLDHERYGKEFESFIQKLVRHLNS